MRKPTQTLRKPTKEGNQLSMTKAWDRDVTHRRSICISVERWSVRMCVYDFWQAWRQTDFIFLIKGVSATLSCSVMECGGSRYRCVCPVKCVIETCTRKKSQDELWHTAVSLSSSFISSTPRAAAPPHHHSVSLDIEHHKQDLPFQQSYELKRKLTLQVLQEDLKKKKKKDVRKRS